RVPGGSATAPRSPSRFPTTTSAEPSASLPSPTLKPHNQPNRRIRTRTYGGVGGEEPQGSPLSRFAISPSGAFPLSIGGPPLITRQRKSFSRAAAFHLTNRNLLIADVLKIRKF